MKIDIPEIDINTVNVYQYTSEGVALLGVSTPEGLLNIVIHPDAVQTLKVLLGPAKTERVLADNEETLMDVEQLTVDGLTPEPEDTEEELEEIEEVDFDDEDEESEEDAE